MKGRGRTRTRCTFSIAAGIDAVLAVAPAPAVIQGKTAVISSTSIDLPEHRQVVKDACLAAGFFPEMMESLPARDEDAIAVSMELVDRADVYIGLYAFRYGFVPKGHDISITEMEFDRATRRGITILPFLIHDQHPIVAAMMELIRLGEAQAVVGGSASAGDTFVRALRAAEQACEKNGSSAAAQRDVAVCHGWIGDVLVAQGDLAGALAAFHESLVRSEALAARDAANTQWQRDLSVSHNKIGDVLVAQGDLGGALQAYGKSLAIREALAARDAVNPGWQRDLSVSHNKIGDVLIAQGDLGSALQAFGKSLALREVLAARDAGNVQWQIDVAVSCSKLGTHAALSVDERRSHLIRGRDLLAGLKAQGRLPPNQDHTGWFDEKLKDLGPGGGLV